MPSLRAQYKNNTEILLVRWKSQNCSTELSNSPSAAFASTVPLIFTHNTGCFKRCTNRAQLLTCFAKIVNTQYQGCPSHHNSAELQSGLHNQHHCLCFSTIFFKQHSLQKMQHAPYSSNYSTFEYFSTTVLPPALKTQSLSLLTDSPILSNFRTPL